MWGEFLNSLQRVYSYTNSAPQVGIICQKIPTLMTGGRGNGLTSAFTVGVENAPPNLASALSNPGPLVICS